MNELPKTIKPGEELEVQIAPYGEYPCRDGDPEHDGFVQRVTPGAVRRIVGNFKPEILVDMDHASETGGGTAAAAWITALRADPERGLVGVFKFTDTGAAAVSARRYRYVSAAWEVDSATGWVRVIVSWGFESIEQPKAIVGSMEGHSGHQPALQGNGVSATLNSGLIMGPRVPFPL